MARKIAMHRTMYRAKFRTLVPERAFILNGDMASVFGYESLGGDIFVVGSKLKEQLAKKALENNHDQRLVPPPPTYMGLKIQYSPVCDPYWRDDGHKLRPHAIRYLRKQGATP